MKQDNPLSRISIDPEVCFGKPCIKGHRIWVSLVLDLLASGKTPQDILDEYPGVQREDVLACIAYGAEMSKQHYDRCRNRSLKLKLDENLGKSVAQVFTKAGHDVATVYQQNMCGIADKLLIPSRLRTIS